MTMGSCFERLAGVLGGEGRPYESVAGGGLHSMTVLA